MLVDEIQRWGVAMFNAPASAHALESCEAKLGHSLPDQFRLLLSATDGVEGEYGLGLVWTAQRIADDNVGFRSSADFRELYMPFDGLVFFADAGNGDQFAISLMGSQEIYVWNHENDSRTWVAPTVMRYLENRMTGALEV
ncbi:SMI1/KNR4 family protein [Microbacterium xanthum]|uniref:SMI1/KNR4 family protein n=1 Tax=Microbacterium xanthum TaxID=3079794 RepID=UPI002AD298B4|nr:SMI1/KNR4 family protein [Microbacterium sp. KSW-48]MDZ8171967.1 SMI1/KNR4 family protein [Microbacterium sp. KSW-48]